jgi:heme-degrading monooxygenase HmoA
MVVVLFHIKLREDADTDEYEIASGRMVELASSIPGFLGIEGFTGEDGSELAVARFDSDDAVRAWRNHPEHLQTQEQGRAEFFAAYDITVAEVTRTYEWSARAISATSTL